MKKTNGIIIYEDLTEIVDPRHSCLIVWDVQNGLVDRIFNKEEFIGNLKVLKKNLQGKMPIVYTLITPVPKEFQSSWSFFSMMKRFNVKEVGKLPISCPQAQRKERYPRPYGQRKVILFWINRRQAFS
jgi:nicotinamidase-related amidase